MKGKMHPNSLKNLEKGKWKPGQSGNPRGRPPREYSITSTLQVKLNEPCDKDPSKTWAEWLALRALELAGENAAFFKELLERTEGKIPMGVVAELAGPRAMYIEVVSPRAKELTEQILKGARTEATDERYLEPPIS